MRVEGHGVTPEEVSIRGGDYALTGYLYMPEGARPFPCLIDNHGSQLPPNTADLSHPQTAAFFMSHGYAYLFPHRAGYGKSPGTALGTDVPAPRGSHDHDRQMSARLDRENKDVIAALDFAVSRPDIDGNRMAVMGSSLGGIHTLLALSRDSRWKCGVDFSGGASQWAAHPIIRNMLIDAVKSLTAPVFLIQPENDFNTAPTEELAALLNDLDKPHEAAIYPKWGTDGAEAHRFCAAGQQIWGARVAKFLARHL